MAFDAQTAWARLGALVASKPNHGRHDLLTEMAIIADECTIPEEEFQQALRLVLPVFAEALFDRTKEAPMLAPEERVTADADHVSHAQAERPTIAA